MSTDKDSGHLSQMAMSCLDSSGLAFMIKETDADHSGHKSIITGQRCANGFDLISIVKGITNKDLSTRLNPDQSGPVLPHDKCE